MKTPPYFLYAIWHLFPTMPRQQILVRDNLAEKLQNIQIMKAVAGIIGLIILSQSTYALDTPASVFYDTLASRAIVKSYKDDIAHFQICDTANKDTQVRFSNCKTIGSDEGCSQKRLEELSQNSDYVKWTRRLRGLGTFLSYVIGGGTTGLITCAATGFGNTNPGIGIICAAGGGLIGMIGGTLHLIFVRGSFDSAQASQFASSYAQVLAVQNLDSYLDTLTILLNNCPHHQSDK